MRGMQAAGYALFFVLWQTTGAFAQSLEDVTGQYLEWRGFSDRKPQTLVREGRIETSGLEGAIKTAQRADGYQRIDVDLEIVQVLEAATPDGGWRIDPGGQMQELAAPELADAQRGLALDMGTVFDGGGEVTLQDAELRDGAEWNVARISYPDGDYTDLFLEPSVGRLGFIRSQKDNTISWLEFPEWETVDGFRFPSRQVQTDAAGDIVTSIAWRSTSVDKPLADDLFATPAPERRVRLPAGAASSEWMPFEFYRDQRIYLPARVNGVETDGVLDSGAEMTVIDDDLARRAGLIGAGDLDAEGTAGVQAAQLATGVSLQIGGVSADNMSVVILDLDAIGGKLLGRPIPLILGKEFFNDLIVDIDYPGRRIAFHDPDNWRYEGSGAVTPVTPLDGLRAIEIRVEGKSPILAAFDTGQASALTLFERYAEREGLLNDRAVSDRLTGGVGGTATERVLSVSSVAIGDVMLRDVPVGVPVSAEGAFDTDRHQANIGAGVFKRFRLIVDYPASRIILEGTPTSIAAPFEKDRSGVQIATGPKGLEVIHVAAGSPAEKAGIEAGAVIVAVDGERVGADYWESASAQWSTAAVGKRVQLQTAAGQTYEIVLDDYY